MRQLTLPDAFAFGRIVEAMDAYEIIKEISEKANTAAEAMELAKDVWGTGYDIAYSLFAAAMKKNAEAQVYEMLSGPFECSVEELKLIPLKQIFDGVKWIVEESDLKSFFHLLKKIL